MGTTFANTTYIWLVVYLPLKNHGVKVNGKDDIPYMKWKTIQPCLKPPTRLSTMIVFMGIINHLIIEEAHLLCNIKYTICEFYYFDFVYPSIQYTFV